jgi:hypothetical protein
MLLPTVQVLSLWYTSVPGNLEWKGLTFNGPPFFPHRFSGRR